jgi:hypothetical protein
MDQGSWHTHILDAFRAPQFLIGLGRRYVKIMQKRKSKNRGLQIHDVRTLRYIHAFLGLILIVAGTLKLYAFASEYQQEDDLATMFLAVLAEMEMIGGAWLVWGNEPERARPWVAAVFTGLWLASLYQVLTGRCSCGCLGSVVISPWFVLIFDTIALAVLLKWQPADGRDETSFGPLGIIGLALAVVCVGLAGIGRQSSLAVAGTAHWRGHPLEDALLVVKGNLLELQVQTDHDGFFSLPPVRAGQYTVAVTRADTPPEPKADPPDRQGARSRAVRGSPREPKRGRARSIGVKASPSGPSELARRYADQQIVSVDLDECSPGRIDIEFK